MDANAAVDADIVRWIYEFLLRQPLKEHLIRGLFNVLPPPVNDFRLKKTIILRKIESEISKGSVSDKVLEYLELIEELDQSEGLSVSESMKAAYCAVAVDCVVRFLGEGADMKSNYFDAVVNIWKGKVSALQQTRESGLISEQLLHWKAGIEEAVWSADAAKRLSTRVTGLDAMGSIRLYATEAWRKLGPSFLELAAQAMRDSMKEGQELNDNQICDKVRERVLNSSREGGDLLACNDIAKVTGPLTHFNRNEVSGQAMSSAMEGQNLVAADGVATGNEEFPKKKVAHKRKHVAKFGRHYKGAKITDLEEPSMGQASRRYRGVPTPEVCKVRKALKSSSSELNAVVTDPLPEALRLANNMLSGMPKENLNHEPLIENPNGKDATVHNSVADPSSEADGVNVNDIENGNSKNQNHNSGSSVNNRDKEDLHVQYLLMENRTRKDTGLLNPSVDKSDEIYLSNTVELNNQGTRNQYTIHRPSLMEPNSTAHVFEWNDSIDESPKGSANPTNRPWLPTPKRKAVSPLKKHDPPKFARRRKMKRWTPLEEDTLRTGVGKFGLGNWKLILNAYRSVFEERTEVDLKDKWRNMIR